MQNNPNQRQTTPSVLLVDDARFDFHHALSVHPDRPERSVAARASVTRVLADWQRIPMREATDEELCRVHDAAFVAKMEHFRNRQDEIDADTYIAPGSIEAARLAAGGLLTMIDRIVDGPERKGVALLRPPGHHAGPDWSMGFCLFNNIAIAAAHARAKGMQRVLIVDWDVHHGNGTQAIFERDPSVLYISLHQYPFFPGSGGLRERGIGDGEGYTVNIPLTAGKGDATYRAAFERVVLPVARAFAPDLVLVSAGFDGSNRDPLAQMQLTSEAFGWMSEALRNIADACAEGRMVLVLEGGYDFVALEDGLTAAIEGMLDFRSWTLDPAIHDEDVERARAAAARQWDALRD